MKNTQFKFNDENTSTCFSRCNVLDCPAEQMSAESFLNGVKPINIPLSDRVEKPYIGKTIDNIFFDDENNIEYFCFTDGTFAIRIEYDDAITSCTSHNVLPVTNKYKSFINNVYASHIVNVSYDYRTIVPNIKITPFGKWLHENTDADVVGFYEKLKLYYEEIERQEKIEQRERDLRQYNYLKEKLGL